MDFFESQELARRNTRRLIVLFVFAVIAIIVAIFAVIVIAVALTNKAQSSDQLIAIALDWRLIFVVTSSVMALIGIGSAMKFFELRQGGSAVASLMGGRRIVGNSKALTDRKIANVVEEMALASGTPVPPVYILDDEESINAFAAGYTVDDAVIGINRGTAEKLTREELQGVVAHEFSHILNGDMRMSMRMIAILNGILLISIIGGQLLHFLSRTAGHSMHRRSSNNNEKGGGGFIIVMYIVALGLYVIGSIGLFFGRWIKSTVSRQREYLADASAVQFTRLPDGIAGALKMIGGTSQRALMKSAGAEEISHMFFGTSRTSLMFATHPPLLRRIQVIDKQFDGNYQKYLIERESRFEKVRRKRQLKDSETKEQNTKDRIQDFFPGSKSFGFDKMGFPVNPLILIAGIGIPTEDDVEFSGFLVNEIPSKFLELIRETFSARCVVFAALLDDDPEIREQQLVLIEKTEAKGTLQGTLSARKLYEDLPIHLRLGVFEIIQGTLSAMSPGQYPTFRKTVNDLILADQVVDLFEFFLFHHLIVHLDRCFGSATARQNLHNKMGTLLPEIGNLISVLACVSDDEPEKQQSAFRSAIDSLNVSTDPDSLFVAKWDHMKLSRSLHKLAKATPTVKKKILSAAVIAIAHDKKFTVQEVELFRAMSESMDCPVPPLVATHETAPKLPDIEIIEAELAE